jgi:tetratricopeptide (TPR) repeat protein
LKFDKRSVEGALELAVASAAFGQIQGTIQMLAFVWKRTGLKTFSTSWGAAWAGMLVGDWIRAEAMLEKALKLQPRQTALVFLLAIVQSRHGKLQSAIINAKRAYDADHTSSEKRKFLIARLLDGGFTGQAQEKIEILKTELDSDPELMLSMTQLRMLQRNFNEAERWTTRIKQFGASAQMLVRLGGLYETARQKDQAASLYQEALVLGHYPEAHLGLGRLETERNNKVEARRHILAALDVERPPGKEGVSTWQMLQPILAQMLWQHEPATNCRAWLAAFPSAQPPVLAGQSFVVFAPDLRQARDYFQTMLDAFHPGKPPLVLSASHFSPAPRPMQPDGPVRPGMQGIWH